MSRSSHWNDVSHTSRSDVEAVGVAAVACGLGRRATESRWVRLGHSCYRRLIELVASAPQDRKQDDRRIEATQEEGESMCSCGVRANERLGLCR